MANGNIEVKTVYRNYIQNLEQYTVFDLQRSSEVKDAMVIIEGEEATLVKYQDVILNRLNVNGFVQDVLAEYDLRNINLVRTQCVLSMPIEEITRMYLLRKYYQTIWPSVSVITEELGKAITSTIALAIKKIQKPVFVGDVIVSDGVVVMLAILKNWPRVFTIIDQVPFLYYPGDVIKANKIDYADTVFVLDITFAIVPTNTVKLPVLQSIGYRPMSKDKYKYVGLTRLANFGGIAVLPQSFPAYTKVKTLDAYREKDTNLFVAVNYMLSAGTSVMQIPSISAGIYRVDLQLVH